MDIIWNELFKQLGIFAILVFFIAWLGKKILEFLMSQDIEVYKSELSRTSEKEIELFKAHLQSMMKERDIRFTKSHEKRIEVISELYMLLWEAHYRATLFNMDLNFEISRYELDQKLSKLPIDIMGDRKPASVEKILNKKEQAEEAYRKIVEFEKYFRKHQLFFSKELCIQVERLTNNLEQIPLFYLVVDNQIDDFLIQAKEELQKWNENESLVEQTLNLIEHEFRKLIGSDVEDINQYIKPG